MCPRQISKSLLSLLQRLRISVVNKLMALHVAHLDARPLITFVELEGFLTRCTVKPLCFLHVDVLTLLVWNVGSLSCKLVLLLFELCK